VRPYAGIGLAILQASATGAGTTVSASDSTVVFWPGGMAIYELPHSAFSVGADLHLVTIPGGPAMCLFAMGGAKF